MEAHVYSSRICPKIFPYLPLKPESQPNCGLQPDEKLPHIPGEQQSQQDPRHTGLEPTH